MRVIFLILLCAIAPSACTQPQRGRPVRSAAASEPIAPPILIAPFEETSQSFLVAGLRFTPGESTVVKVCIAADRTIESTEVIESSGDKRFDQVAIQWARQVKIRSATQDVRLVEEKCGSVRVEIRKSTEPRVIAGPDVSLG